MGLTSAAARFQECGFLRTCGFDVCQSSASPLNLTHLRLFLDGLPLGRDPRSFLKSSGPNFKDLCWRMTGDARRNSHMEVYMKSWGIEGTCFTWTCCRLPANPSHASHSPSPWISVPLISSEKGGIRTCAWPSQRCPAALAAASIRHDSFPTPLVA